MAIEARGCVLDSRQESPRTVALEGLEDQPILLAKVALTMMPGPFPRDRRDA